MNENELKAARGEVIDKFATIETAINAIISQHYLKSVNREFIIEVLCDESFSFGLRRRILEKIVPASDKSDRSKMQNLVNLNSTRNYFAHCGLQMTSLESDVPFYPDTRKPKKQLIEWDNLYRDFNKLLPEVVRYLKEKMDQVGVSYDEPEDDPSGVTMRIGFDD